MINLPAFNDSNIRLTILLMCPQITKHFFVIAIKRHAIFPGLCNIFILFKNMFSQKLKATFYWFYLSQKIIVDGPKHIIVPMIFLVFYKCKICIFIFGFI